QYCATWHLGPIETENPTWDAARPAGVRPSSGIPFGAEGMSLMLGAATLVLVSLGVWLSVVFRMQRAEFWEFQIRAFEQAERSHPPAEGAILFTGSSSIRYWST